MKLHTHTFWLTGGIFLLCLTAKISPTQAQNVPVADTTLPVNSVVNPLKDNITIIEGTVAGHNLFHSFQQFNVGEGQKVYFDNPAGIENIFSRVTGSNPSKILGTLGVIGGSANLFFINPNGIVLGPKAILDVKGSFVATTANAIRLSNGDIFNVNPVEPLPTQLLNVNPNAFLFNQIANQPINSIEVNGASLSVADGQSLLLVGGKVSPTIDSTGGILIEGGSLDALGGRVELGGLAAPGTVELNTGNNLSLNFPKGVTRADVSLTNGASVSVTSKGGGSIAINARNLDVSDNSSLEAGIAEDLGAIHSVAGDITLDATEGMKISGSRITNDVGFESVGNSGSILIKAGSLSLTDKTVLSTTIRGEGETGGIFVQANKSVSIASSSITTGPDERTGIGNGGNINIQTGSLYLTELSELDTSTSREGRAGDVTIDAQNIVLLDNSSISSQTFGPGDGGTINLKANELSLSKGGVISSTTSGKGNAGDININPINAFSSVTISGVNADPNNGFSSGLVTSTEKEGGGKGGDITVNTGALRISDGGVLSARTRNASLGGKITVNANTLDATNGGQLLTSTFDTGRAGNIKVTATDSVNISGSDPTYTNRFQQQLNPTIVDNDGSASGLLARVQGQETADAGDIQVQAPSIHLDNQGVISAATKSGEGGNINLQVRDLILMRGKSQISAEALNKANGGNITINAKDGFIIAVPSESSNINARADEGRGGNIEIASSGIYGFVFHPDSSLSYIDASSKAGPQLNGTVEINTPDVDPSRGLVSLPITPVDTKVSQVCQPSVGKNQSSFIITGRGGLPPNPREPLSSDAVQVDWVTLNPKTENRSHPSVTKNPTPATPAQIVQATGWTRNAKGEVVLTADAPTTTSHSSWQTPANCGTAESIK